jgi:diadenosine tetraphosphate (Ap4A) HIT family hydrolase
MEEPSQCPFCSLPAARVWIESEVGIAFLDGFPVTEGHTLVIPRRHLASVFELSPDDLAGLWQMVAEVRARLDHQHSPEGFNIGVNDGEAAGQTVAHAHIHVIPRRKGDVADPRGGVRWIIPDKADYWSDR